MAVYRRGMEPVPTLPPPQLRSHASVFRLLAWTHAALLFCVGAALALIALNQPSLGVRTGGTAHVAFNFWATWILAVGGELFVAALPFLIAAVVMNERRRWPIMLLIVWAALQGLAEAAFALR